jgi:hypothetical protein
VELLVLDVHGGTTEDDIVNIFDKANRIRLELSAIRSSEEKEQTHHSRSVYVFLDEVNTCSHMGLICEAITMRSLKGRQIHDDIHVLAALNPYRRRTTPLESFGLVFKHKKTGSTFGTGFVFSVFLSHSINSSSCRRPFILGVSRDSCTCIASRFCL